MAELTGWRRRAVALGRTYLMVVGTLVTLAAAWLLSPLPLLLDDPLVFIETREPSAAIVCLGGGSIQG
ncbi:MAG: hypothetical protein ACRD00_02925, partial [Thermoanaerobaculia bacterium]